MYTFEWRPQKPGGAMFLLFFAAMLPHDWASALAARS